MRKQTFDFRFDAAPAAVFRAFLNPTLLPKWRVPDNMRMTIHEFEPVESGKFRISLTYEDRSSVGKSGQHTDTYKGHFATLVPNEKIVEVIEFESTDAAFSGEMVITTQLYPEDGGTKMVATHENLPIAVPSDQNEIGWKMSLKKLAKLLQE
jgi:uncharacterized protein YndB with AHSA1/START domain